jgi:hypothetical protein
LSLRSSGTPIGPGLPGCARAVRLDRALPARGMMLRHTYRTVAADLGIAELLTEFLMGHTPEGISRKYILKLVLSSGSDLREAQRKISKRICALLGVHA